MAALDTRARATGQPVCNACVTSGGERGGHAQHGFHYVDVFGSVSVAVGGVAIMVMVTGLGVFVNDCTGLCLWCGLKTLCRNVTSARSVASRYTIAGCLGLHTCRIVQRELS